MGKQFLLTYRIGRIANEGYGNYSLVTASSLEEATEKLIKATKYIYTDALYREEQVADQIHCLNID